MNLRCMMFNASINEKKRNFLFIKSEFVRRFQILCNKIREVYILRFR